MKSKNKLIADIALAYKPTAILDIGYAQSPNEHLVADNTRVFGVDLVQRPAPYESTAVCDLNTQKLPFDDGAMDVVTMGCTLAHVANPLRTLGDINRVLKDNGILILSSPNPNYYWETILNVFFNYFKDRVSKAKHVEHFFEFSRYNIRTIGGRAGFEVIDEIGSAFQLVKTPFRFSPKKLPGIAYEIIYVLRKKKAPESFATFQEGGRIDLVPTELYR